MYLLIHHFTVQNLEGIQMNVLMEREDGIADGGVVGQAEVFLRRPRGRGWITVPIGENLQTVLTSTKYISGGGTGLGGLLIDYGKFDWSQSPSPALQARIKKVGKKLAFTARVKTELITNLCALMTPQAAYMETLGLDTLDIRFRRQAETTLWLAKQCQKLPEIKRVNYTGLEDNPFSELSREQFGPLPGAVFTIDLESKEAAFAFIDKLQIIRRATNLFDRKSLAIHPASTIFGLFSPEQCAEMSVPDTTIRLSIGLETGEDLLEDITQSLT